LWMWGEGVLVVGDELVPWQRVLHPTPFLSISANTSGGGATKRGGERAGCTEAGIPSLNLTLRGLLLFRIGFRVFEWFLRCQ
jgi:hypothetical protein